MNTQIIFKTVNTLCLLINYTVKGLGCYKTLYKLETVFDNKCAKNIIKEALQLINEMLKG